MNILLLAGSPSHPSRSTRLLHHVGGSLAILGHRYVKLQVRDLPAQALLHADLGDPDVMVARAQVAQADAIVISTPVYKAAYSGVLKTFLDILPQDGLAGKLVLPLATGGSQSHMLALDYALRPVLSALSARHVLSSIYVTDSQLNWSAQHGLSIAPEIAQRIAAGVEQLSVELSSGRESVAIATRAASSGVTNAVSDFASIAAPVGVRMPVQFSQVRCSAK